MNKPTYYGEYTASTLSQTGCVKRFITVATDSILFPPQVSYDCDLCKKSHGFRFVRAWSVATNRQALSFDSYCNEHALERDVDIS